MATPSLDAALEAARTRLRAELDEQLSAIQIACTHALAEAHLAAHTAADERWTAKFEVLAAASTARADADAKQAAATAASADQRWATRLQEQQAASVIRSSAAAAEAVAAADQRWTAKLEQLESRAAIVSAVPASTGSGTPAPADENGQTRFTNGQSESQPAGAAGSHPSPPAAGSDGPALRRLADAVSALSAATSLSTTLDTLAAAAHLEASRTALFVVNGRTLERWAAGGFAAGHEPADKIHLDNAGPFAQALTTGQPVTGDFKSGPGFATGPAGMIAPLMVGDQCVAVLYADGGDRPEPVQDTVAILARHASSCLSRVIAQALATAGQPGTSPAAPVQEDDNSARRYARLLVSEIKLYNEAAVRIGRERRDLLTRLRPDIDRARRLYEARVPHSIGSREALFQQELVQTLAEGDPALLGAAD